MPKSKWPKHGPSKGWVQQKRKFDSEDRTFEYVLGPSDSPIAHFHKSGDIETHIVIPIQG